MLLAPDRGPKDRDHPEWARAVLRRDQAAVLVTAGPVRVADGATGRARRGWGVLLFARHAQTDYPVDPDRSLTIFHNRPELKFEFRPVAGEMHSD